MQQSGGQLQLIQNPHSRARVSNNIYVIDCTIAPPKQDKIDRIRNTSFHLATTLGCNVRPYIVCSAYCPSVKKSANESGVVIIDKEDLQKMIGLLKNPLRPWELSTILDDETQKR